MKIYINRTYALKDLNQAQADLSSADKAIINIVIQKAGGFLKVNRVSYRFLSSNA
jgi:hypothetical protein